MMTQLTHNITSDINQTLRTISKYSWVVAGVLFLGYGYFVGAITFSVVKQQTLEQSIKGLVSDISKQELSYLSAQKDLGLDTASTMGLTPTTVATYAVSRRAFAWNVER
jgi:hypothetical protein